MSLSARLILSLGVSLGAHAALLGLWTGTRVDTGQANAASQSAGSDEPVVAIRLSTGALLAPGVLSERSLVPTRQNGEWQVLTPDVTERAPAPAASLPEQAADSSNSDGPAGPMPDARPEPAAEHRETVTPADPGTAPDTPPQRVIPPGGMASLPAELQRSLRAVPAAEQQADRTAVPAPYQRYQAGAYRSGDDSIASAPTALAPAAESPARGSGAESASEAGVDPQVVRGDYARQLREAIRARQHYPEQAVRRRQEGVVNLRFRLLANGRVEDVAVIGSSGHQALDDAAHDLLVQLDPFPALPDMQGGQPDYLTFELPVVYQLR